MLVNEIEEAEKSAEEILQQANEKASARLLNARTKSYEGIVEGARDKTGSILEKSEAEAKAEAKKISSSKRGFTIPADAKKRLVESLVNAVLSATAKKC